MIFKNHPCKVFSEPSWETPYRGIVFIFLPCKVFSEPSWDYYDRGIVFIAWVWVLAKQNLWGN